jgi:hypothetical protein
MRQLSEQEREDSATAEAAGQMFAGVTPAQIFSAAADGVLAQQIHRLNPARYYQLKQEWLFESGQERRPLTYYK